MHLRRPSRRAALALVAVAALGAVGVGVAVAGGGDGRSGYRVEERFVDVVDGPRRDQRVRLDTTLYLPAGAGPTDRRPAVISTPGFGGGKDDLRDDAADLAGHGYVVLAYTARGLGRSTGQVALASPDYEVADVRQLVDLLAARPEVQLDAPGDPRVGLTGASYGGGISLLAAAHDRRVDAVVPVIAWHSLTDALSPNAAVGSRDVGVFKQQWAGILFGGGALCLRARPEVCRAYQDTAVAGRLTPAARALLDRAGPAGVLDRVRAPTLLVQGEDDTLFPLREAVANRDGIARAGTPAAMAWVAGGHDAPFTGGQARQVRALTRGWLDRWLRRDAAVDTGPPFRYARGRASGTGTSPPSRTASWRLSDDGRLVEGAPAGTPARPRKLFNPPGGRPAALSGLPGVGGLQPLLRLVSLDLPGQHVAFETGSLPGDVEVVGAPRVRVRLTSGTGGAVLFAKLYDVGASGTATLPGQQVAPLRVGGLPPTGVGRPVDVELPTLAHLFARGHRIRLVLASTDQAYADEREPALIGVSGGPDGVLTLPAAAAPSRSGALSGALLAAGLGALALAAAVALAHRRRRAARGRGTADPDAPPVVVAGLTKTFDGGVRAVDGVSFTVGRGQVLGLLGPNGAGKTTTLRMLLGLVHPTAGEVRLLGRTVRPGAPVLERVGAFVEGPGLLPHLSGLDNLRLYWRSTGARLADAGIEQALAVAGLGEAVHRRVRTYSHGMRQRLALAQAMLGAPDLLVLDEPTNGLDPPQIRQMRELIRRVAAGGVTVLLSSHLLAEVEQTCTHVVVMDHGRLVAAGPVEEITGTGATVRVDVAPADAAAALPVVRGLAGVRSARPDGNGTLVVELSGLARSALVRALVGAGVAVEGVSARRRLEEVFLRLVGEER